MYIAPPFFADLQLVKLDVLIFTPSLALDNILDTMHPLPASVLSIFLN
jgi:hypothetical protein